jgi:putative inorganic carbon (hco3(-)) transporter
LVVACFNNTKYDASSRLKKIVAAQVVERLEMGFALTLTYIVVTIISPDQFGATFASYHPMVYLAGVTAVASLPEMLSCLRWRFAIQAKLLLCLLVAIALSEVANGWFGGVIEGWQTILPSAAVFFFLIANVTTVRRLKIAVWVTIGTCLGISIEAMLGYYWGFRGDAFVLLQYGEILRLRAAGFLNDPNDLAQIQLIAFPLLFIGWNRGRIAANSFMVLLPGAFLLWAVYLTHSRGALIALAVLALMAAQERIGKAASAVMSGLFIFGMIALDFTGGRGISAADGADRLEAWAGGLELFKRAPLFGIGFGRFTDFNGITAHNSFVLCLAELGLVGSTIWVALNVTAMMDLNSVIALHECPPEEVEAADESVIEEQSALLAFGSSSNPTSIGTRDEGASGGSADEHAVLAYGGVVVGEPEDNGHADVSEWPPAWLEPNLAPTTSYAVETTIVTGEDEAVPKRFAVVMRLAFISFLTTGFFLSRSYVTTMFLMLGLATATISLEQHTLDLDDRYRRAFITAGIELLAILFIYFIVRFRH